MKAMVFAAGEGRRMQPLTESIPKPLIQVAGKSLLEHRLRALVSAGVSELIVNAFYLSEQIARAVDEMALPVPVQVSVEPEPLETGGGLNYALPLLGQEPFILVNADVWTDYPFSELVSVAERLSASSSRDGALAHIVLVPNPLHHPTGDFYLEHAKVSADLQPGGRVFTEGKPDRLTFSGLSVIHPALLTLFDPGERSFPLAAVLKSAMRFERVLGEFYTGFWSDIGTPQRLAELRLHLSNDGR